MVATYAAEALPLLKQKSQIAASLLSHGKIKDEQLEAIMQHTPHWQVASPKDLSEIEELNTYLDNRLGSHLQVLQAFGDQTTKGLLQQLQGIDGQLEKIRSKLDLGLKPSPQQHISATDP